MRQVFDLDDLNQEAGVLSDARACGFATRRLIASPAKVQNGS
jgi:hypothetical protein